MALFNMDSFYGRILSHTATHPPLVEADIKPPLRTVGVKGSDVYTAAGVGDALLALSVQLVRGVHPETVLQHVTDALKSSSSRESLEDIFVLLFQTRDIRGGKGERDASMAMWNALLTSQQTRALALNLMDLIPRYGCWQDMFKLPPVAWPRMLHIVEKQIQADELAVCDGSSNVSLLAKWMPREGQPMVHYCAAQLVPGQMFAGTRMKLYRKRISALNRLIQPVEIKMCSTTDQNSWSSIDPSRVPGRAVKKYTKAFLNELGTMRKGGERTGSRLRHPNSEDRMTCRDHFQEYFSKAASGAVKAKGADTLFPHEVVKKAMFLLRTDTGSEEEKNSLRGVWRQMVEVAKAGGGLGRSLAMCDYSWSMQSSGSNGDTPYWVSMALGLLISEVTTAEFKDLMLTFDSRPTFHRFPEGDLFEKLASIAPTMAQGTSTDFRAAMRLVLEVLKATNVRPGEEPENLIVLTDMNWDQASNYEKSAVWQTHVEITRAEFEHYGWKMPSIVIWNIASTSPDFHAQSTTEGVAMISGWSPSLFKVLQTQGPSGMTPHVALRIQLDDQRYDIVRERVRDFLSN